MNVASLVCAHDPEAPAVHDGTRWVPWGEIRRRASALRDALSGGPLWHVDEGDRVALVLPNSVDFVVAYLATLAAGAVAVPLNPNAPAAEVEGQLRVVNPRVVLGAGSIVEHGGEEASQTDAREEDRGFEPVERAESDLAVLLFTSGTAGPPKAAMLTHGNLVSNLEQMLEVPGDITRADDVVLAAVPLFHVFGLNVVLGLALATGAGLVVQERFDPEKSLRRVVDLGVTILPGVPEMFGAWSRARGASGTVETAGLGALRLALSGAAALEPAVAEAFEKRFGVPVSQGYGLTETSPAVSTSLGTGRNRRASVGRPIPGVSVRLVGDDGKDVLGGDPGEIWVKGPNVFVGYWEDDEATRSVLSEQGWLRTGDVGVLGEDGDLYVVDRLKDIVIVSGFNVFPGEVESCISSLTGVREAVVVAVPDPVTGEAVEAHVALEPGSRLRDQDVLDHCRSRLARYKCPTSVKFVDDLPHGLTGNALRRSLERD